MASLLGLVSLVTVSLVSVLVFRAAFLYKPLPAPKSCINMHNHDNISLSQDPQILKRFIGALNIPTISYKVHTYDAPEMTKFIEYIEKSYPAIHGSPLITREIVANYSLLYTVKGSDPKLRPYMLTSHIDVVPAVKELWDSNPFKAVIKDDGYIYARGTMDAKHLVMAIFEATEFMIKKGFKPRRTYYMAFGHDEEVLGLDGAQEIAKILKVRTKTYDKMEYVIDEGLVISETKFPGLPYNIGLIGVAEKGYLSVKVTATGAVGHGSMPPPMTAIAKLSTVLSRFHANVMPSFLGEGVEREMFEIFAAYASWPYKLIYSNFWFFKPIISYVMSNNPTLNALVRSTTAVTMVHGGTKENVLPDSAWAILNHRIHQAQSGKELMELDRQLINDDTITMELSSPINEPGPVSPYCDDCSGYQTIKHSLLQVFPDTVVVPSIFLAATDSKWYTNLTDSIYRFSAISVELEEMKCFHGHNERLSVKNYEKLINFYHHLIINSDEPILNYKSKQHDEL
ncbi:N-fatty-acyl-amino acid synthase/hydrolase PM20D1 [Fragariocoptes setiger]|uniref:N-fatty-acyl-amino acid synthase/hydrolase PM20D1 n=1 Tax=Fragariocoptes setiger TaxID=1670756 RepID=A0ABQ7SAQ1_9ACAR|nr:N-fatty-acyl-amino acid synthase/hydrolase PM20D1 [Fragariocoptes setiger]